MRKLTATVLGLALALTGLAGCSSSDDTSRTIEVDYQADQFAGAFLGYFPRNFTVPPGTTVKFHQTWTGEPHSVTMGTIVNEGYAPLKKLLDGYLDGSIPIPDEPPAEYNSEIWDEKLPELFGGEEGKLNQTAALPCYAPKESDLPLDKAKPCAKKFQEKPEFDGTHAYYSSGFIPFEGDLANEFELKLADDIEEGTYAYYCNVHGVLMSGAITVKEGAKLESQGALNRRGRSEVNRMIKPLLKDYEAEKAGNAEFPLPLAGSGGEGADQVHAGVLEFTPRTIEAKVGEKVTWSFIGDHTISFNVPPYSPIFVYDKKGNLAYNDDLDKPRGGWPGPPERDYDGEGEPPPAVDLDAGDFDGSGGLKSSGTGFDDGDKYSVTFTKAGTYPYACLIHPGMIGKVIVK